MRLLKSICYFGDALVLHLVLPLSKATIFYLCISVSGNLQNIESTVTKSGVGILHSVC